MRRILLLAVALGLLSSAKNARADVLFESGTLGPTGIPWSDLESGTIPGTNVSEFVFPGVRFHLDYPALITHVGGHFASPSGGTFFGAIVQLDDANDFPDSGNLSTSDVLGSTVITFPESSAEVFGDLSLSLEPGWYALVFGSELLGAAGSGGAVQNGSDLGNAAYIMYQPGFDWGNPINPIFRNYRFVVLGDTVPEPSIAGLMSALLFSALTIRNPKR